MQTRFERQITLGVTGASGAPYTLELLKQLTKAKVQVYLLFSSAAKIVFKTEVELDIPGNPSKASEFFTEYCNAAPEQIQVVGNHDWFSPPASGSAAPKQMVVLPCSTGTLSAIANGTSDNLLERAADVVIKEKGQLILVPRETPFSAIHLDNMSKLAHIGVTIMPAAPGFYHQPKSIDDLVKFMVARILDHLKVDQDIVPRWGYSK